MQKAKLRTKGMYAQVGSDITQLLGVWRRNGDLRSAERRGRSPTPSARNHAERSISAQSEVEPKKLGIPGTPASSMEKHCTYDARPGLPRGIPATRTSKKGTVVGWSRRLRDPLDEEGEGTNAEVEIQNNEGGNLQVIIRGGSKTENHLGGARCLLSRENSN